MRLAVIASLLPLALLAACQSEAQQLAAGRTQALEKCNSDPRIKASTAGMDTGRFCTCLTNKMFDGRSLADIEKMGEDSNNATTQKAAMDWSAQCAVEQLRSDSPQGTAAAPAAPAAAPVAVETQNAAAETVEETADEVE